MILQLSNSRDISSIRRFDVIIPSCLWNVRKWSTISWRRVVARKMCPCLQICGKSTDVCRFRVLLKQLGLGLRSDMMELELARNRLYIVKALQETFHYPAGLRQLSVLRSMINVVMAFKERVKCLLDTCETCLNATRDLSNEERGIYHCSHANVSFI